MSANAGGWRAGCFGKLPGYGDFVSRALPERFVSQWDTWLRQAIEASQLWIGPSWSDVFRTSPIWRFVLSADIAGPQAWAGVLMPSADAHLRWFPFTIACPVAPGAASLSLLIDHADWFAAAEHLAMSGLDEDFELGAFDNALLGLGPLADGTAEEPPRGESSLCLRGIPPERLDATCETLLALVLPRALRTYSLWCTSGSAEVIESLAVCQGLPSPGEYAAMLDGSWRENGWQVVDLELPDDAWLEETEAGYEPAEGEAEDLAPGETEADEPALEGPAAGEPALEETAPDEPALWETAAHEPAQEESAAHEPAQEESAAHEPALWETAVDEPAQEESAADEPAQEESAADEPVPGGAEDVEVPPDVGEFEEITTDIGADVESGATGSSAEAGVADAAPQPADAPAAADEEPVWEPDEDTTTLAEPAPAEEDDVSTEALALEPAGEPDEEPDWGAEPDPDLEALELGASAESEPDWGENPGEESDPNLEALEVGAPAESEPDWGGAPRAVPDPDLEALEVEGPGGNEPDWGEDPDAERETPISDPDPGPEKR